MLNVVIAGPNGKMGRALCGLAGQDADIARVVGLVKPGGTSTLAGLDTVSNLADAASGNAAGKSASVRTVLIDFTAPGATLDYLAQAVPLGIPVVIGTTGFSADQMATIEQAAEKLPVLISANMSLGINLLSGIVENLARKLPEYDIEIIETHHRLKKDAPSGTALLLGRAAAQGRDVALDDVAVHGREGDTGIRPAGPIGFHAVRGGDVIGDHTVLFAGTGERVEITHKASSRETFAAGAIFAAKFLAGQNAGLYSMKDALGLA